MVAYHQKEISKEHALVHEILMFIKIAVFFFRFIANSALTLEKENVFPFSLLFSQSWF